jgi:hypothetical protein
MLLRGVIPNTCHITDKGIAEGKRLKGAMQSAQ